MKHGLPKTGVREASLKDPLTLNLKPGSRQTARAEMEEEIDMPGWSPDQVRDAFMRPVRSRPESEEAGHDRDI